jgi:hypothetical protein
MLGTSGPFEIGGYVNVKGSLNLADFGAASVPADERRREPRVACARHIALLPFCEERFVAGRFADCSPRGVGVIVPRALTIDEQFIIKMAGRNVTLLVYHVRNCRPDGGVFRVGGELSGCIGSAANVSDRAVLTLLLGGSLDCL